MHRTFSLILFALLIMSYFQPGTAQNQPRENSAVTSDSATGSISGLIFDNSCSTVLRWVNIIVEGTSLGTMSDSLGNFLITSIPRGTYTVKAMGMGYNTESKSVEVIPFHNARIDFSLREIWSDEALGNPDAVAPICELHHIPMEIVLVPIGYGLRVSDREYHNSSLKEFPNAEPSTSAGCVIKPPIKSWEPRCQICITARNTYIAGTDCLDHDILIPDTWKTYHVGAVSFKAPKAQSQHADTSGCSIAECIESEDLTIQASLSVHNQYPRFSKPGRIIRPCGRIISRDYAQIYIERVDSTTTTFSEFPVLPNGTRAFAMSVSTDNSTAIEMALAVIESVRFINE